MYLIIGVSFWKFLNSLELLAYLLEDRSKKVYGSKADFFCLKLFQIKKPNIFAIHKNIFEVNFMYKTFKKYWSALKYASCTFNMLSSVVNKLKVSKCNNNIQ